MSKSNPIFNSIPVEIPDRSGFDLSHEVLTTAKVGTVVPVTHFEVLPGDTISMGSLMKVTLPPFAVPFMGRIDAELTAAFIPYRLLWQGWQSFITQNTGVSISTPSQTMGLPLRVPHFIPNYGTETGGSYRDFFGPGTLMHYLGFKASPDSAIGLNQPVSALPALAYHKFCDDWIRDDNNIKPFFPKINPGDAGFSYAEGSSGLFDFVRQGRMLPYRSTTGSNYSGSEGNSLVDTRVSLGARPEDADTLPDVPVDFSIGLGSLRQRCWAKDYFTTATTRPQAGDDSSVSFEVPVTIDPETGQPSSTPGGAFTVAQLRAANSLQRWLERNNIAGTDYGAQIMAHFGVMPPDAVLNRSVLLGSVRTPVYVGSVDNNSNAEASETRNPYGSVLGSAAGFGSGADRGSLIDSFSPKEHGLIMVFFTLIPHAYYNSGIERQLMHLEFGDFAWPEFSGIGDQPIYNVEVSNNAFVTGGIFGYQQRYAEYKHIGDRVTGLLSKSDGSHAGDISVYALQRSFGNVPALGKAFLEIPEYYLDEYYALSTELTGFGCMVDAFFDTRALRVLPEYSLPHL